MYFISFMITLFNGYGVTHNYRCDVIDQHPLSWLNERKEMKIEGPVNDPERVTWYTLINWIEITEEEAKLFNGNLHREEL